MVTLQRCRGVDAAAGQLIVREAGGFISFVDLDDPLDAPLDATPSSRLVAARIRADAARARGDPAAMTVIDWILAEKIAGYLAGTGDAATPAPTSPRWPLSPSGG